MMRDVRREFSTGIFLIAAAAFVLVMFPVFRDALAQTDKAVKKSPGLPRIVDVGSERCIPCRMMKPVLEELKKEYAGVLIVEFVDVWENPRANEQYRIRGIPTQIFYNANGKELKRHIGFISKEEILAEFQKSGISLKPSERKGKQ
ncbi:MAG: Thioredoxin [Syntrophorhabdus sp. PtaU1.Bin153]|nr:MAG: Thioredoxin [Syntrophorhabdus sp. PtaU1.Bin153]